ncbi:MAG: hypothetical protein ACLT35_11120 [Christensenellales bacterium]
MRKLLTLLLLLLLLLTSSAMAAEKSAYRLADEQGTLLAWLDVPPAVGDVLLTADGTRHRVIAVEGQQAVLREDGTETLPDVPWSARETAQPVTSAVRTIGLMGDAALVRDLREGLANQGAALVTVNPEQADFPLTVARDEISNSAEYDTLLSGEKAAKIRLIVRRGGDNEALMKDFALSVKAGLDHTAPTLIRDVYFAANAQEPLRMLWGARETEPIRLQNTIAAGAGDFKRLGAPRHGWRHFRRRGRAGAQCRDGLDFRRRSAAGGRGRLRAAADRGTQAREENITQKAIQPMKLNRLFQVRMVMIIAVAQ